MTEQEKTALTAEVLTLHNQINEFGRKSVPLVVQCGKRLTDIQKGLTKGKWMDWQAEHSGEISVSTINRYKRVSPSRAIRQMQGQKGKRLPCSVASPFPRSKVSAVGLYSASVWADRGKRIFVAVRYLLTDGGLNRHRKTKLQL